MIDHFHLHLEAFAIKMGRIVVLEVAQEDDTSLGRCGVDGTMEHVKHATHKTFTWKVFGIYQNGFVEEQYLPALAVIRQELQDSTAEETQILIVHDATVSRYDRTTKEV